MERQTWKTAHDRWSARIDNFRYITNDECPLAFAFVRKAGATSLYNMLSAQHKQEWYDFSYDEVIQKNKVFAALIRHPIKRFIAWYINYNDPNFKSGGYHSDDNFRYVIDMCCSLNAWHLDTHISPQCYLVDVTVVKNIFKMEEIDKFNKFLQEYNIGPLPHENKTKYDLTPIKNFFTHNPEYLEKLKKLYEQDFILFDYDADIQLL